MQATRNGYFFVLDRTTGEHLVTSKFSPAANWAKDIDPRGRPVRDAAKDFHVGGALVSPTNAGATNWMPASFSPDTGLFYLASEDGYAMYYLTETDPRGAMGLGGKDERGIATVGTYHTGSGMLQIFPEAITVATRRMVVYVVRRPAVQGNWESQF